MAKKLQYEKYKSISNGHNRCGYKINDKLIDEIFCAAIVGENSMNTALRCV